MDEEKNRTLLKDMEERTLHVPSAAERRSAAAIQAILDEDEEEDMASYTKNDAEQPLDMGNLGPHPSLRSSMKPAPSFWAKLQTGWSGVEDRLVEFFGREQSKFVPLSS